MEQQASHANIWAYQQEKVDIAPYTKLYQLDDQEMETLNTMLSEPQVEIIYELNDETDYAAPYIDLNGVTKVARISEFVSINGVRWNLVPGRNPLPKTVYEFLMQCPEQRNRVSKTDHYVRPNEFVNRGSYYVRTGSQHE